MSISLITVSTQGSQGVTLLSGGNGGEVLPETSISADYYFALIVPDSGGGSSVWGSITGVLSDQSDLQAALNLKSHLLHTHNGVYEPHNSNIQQHITATGNTHGLTATDISLGNVDNTSDANKPVSTATQAALNLKSHLLHTHNGVYEPHNSNIQQHITATGNTHGLTATDISLGNVDNTSDANKPVSTATQAAIDALSVSSSGSIPFSFSSLTPNSDRGDTSPTPLPVGMVMLDDETIVLNSLTAARLDQYTMIDGDPANLVYSGISFNLVSGGGNMGYDRVRKLLYIDEFATASTRQIILTGNTLVGAVMSPVSFSHGNGRSWATAVSNDGRYLYLTSLSSNGRVYWYSFSTVGSLSAMTLISTRDYLPGESELGSIMLSPNDRRMIISARSGPSLHVTDFLTTGSIASLSAADTPSHTYSSIPFGGTGVLSVQCTSPDGFSLYFLTSSAKSLVRFSMG